MKLYHASDYENKESIEEFGLCPTDCGSKIVDPSKFSLQNNSYTGIYGFINLDDAIEFGRDNGFVTVVFMFDAPDCDTINDPEYDGQAMFCKTQTSLSAEVVYDYYQD